MIFSQDAELGTSLTVSNTPTRFLSRDKHYETHGRWKLPVGQRVQQERIPCPTLYSRCRDNEKGTKGDDDNQERYSEFRSIAIEGECLPVSKKPSLFLIPSCSAAESNRMQQTYVTRQIMK